MVGSPLTRAKGLMLREKGDGESQRKTVASDSQSAFVSKKRKRKRKKDDRLGFGSIRLPNSVQ
jgi:hypothetical protein